MVRVLDVVLAAGPMAAIAATKTFNLAMAKVRKDKTLAREHVFWRLDGYAAAVDRYVTGERMPPLMS